MPSIICACGSRDTSCLRHFPQIAMKFLGPIDGLFHAGEILVGIKECQPGVHQLAQRVLKLCALRLRQEGAVKHNAVEHVGFVRHQVLAIGVAVCRHSERKSQKQCQQA